MFFAIVPWRDINIENFVLRESNLPFWVSVKLSNTLKTQIKQDKQSICVTLQERKKKWGQANYFLYGVFDHS